MTPATITLLSLLSNCLHVGLAEAVLLRGLETRPENAVTTCITEQQCRQKYEALNFGGYFYVSAFPTSGCFSKKDDVFFGTGGTLAEMSAPAPGIQERIWCDRETNEPTANPAAKQVTNSPTQALRMIVPQPTRMPVTDNPTTWPTSKPVTNSPTKLPTPKPVTASPTSKLQNDRPLPTVSSKSPPNVTIAPSKAAADETVPPTESPTIVSTLKSSVPLPTVAPTAKSRSSAVAVPSPATIVNETPSLTLPSPSTPASPLPTSSPTTNSSSMINQAPSSITADETASATLAPTLFSTISSSSLSSTKQSPSSSSPTTLGSETSPIASSTATPQSPASSTKPAVSPVRNEGTDNSSKESEPVPDHLSQPAPNSAIGSLSEPPTPKPITASPSQKSTPTQVTNALSKEPQALTVWPTEQPVAAPVTGRPVLPTMNLTEEGLTEPPTLTPVVGNPTAADAIVTTHPTRDLMSDASKDDGSSLVVDSSSVPTPKPSAQSPVVTAEEGIAGGSSLVVDSSLVPASEPSAQSPVAAAEEGLTKAPTVNPAVGNPTVAGTIVTANPTEHSTRDAWEDGGSSLVVDSSSPTPEPSAQSPPVADVIVSPTSPPATASTEAPAGSSRETDATSGSSLVVDSSLVPAPGPSPQLPLVADAIVSPTFSPATTSTEAPVESSGETDATTLPQNEEGVESQDNYLVGSTEREEEMAQFTRSRWIVVGTCLLLVLLVVVVVAIRVRKKKTVEEESEGFIVEEPDHDDITSLDITHVVQNYADPLE